MTKALHYRRFKGKNDRAIISLSLRFCDRKLMEESEDF